MSLVALADAKLHLRVDGSDEDALIGLYLNAAEQSAVGALDRAVYPDGAALQAAKAAAPGQLATATVAYTAAIAAAEAMADQYEQSLAIDAAERAYARARIAYRQALDGIAVTDTIRAAVLLITGHLYANREDVIAGSVSAMPNGADYLLQPYKVYR